MKKLLIILWIICNIQAIFCQDSIYEYIYFEEDTISPVFLILQENPKFNGNGDINELRKFINDNLTLPKSDDCFVTYFLLSFVVDTTGYIINEKIEIDDNKIHCISGDKEEIKQKYKIEVMKMLEKIPRFEPGKQGGKIVPVKVSFPIHTYYDF